MYSRIYTENDWMAEVMIDNDGPDDILSDMGSIAIERTQPGKREAEKRKAEMGTAKKRESIFMSLCTFGPGEKFPSEPPS